VTTAAVETAAAALRARDQERRAAWVTAARTLAPRGLAALLGGPRWTTAALAAIDPAALAPAATPLVRREGRGERQLVDVDPRALRTLRAELDARRAAATDPAARSALEPAPLAMAIAGALAEGAPMPKVLARWRSLALGLTEGAYALADRLLADVRAACEAGTPGQVLDLLEAADALERLVGGPLTMAVQIGRHQVDHGYRTADDLAQLAGYVARAEPQAAFEEIMAGAGPWALHYLGVGGVGKTTFLRHLCVNVAHARGLVVARVDFDYLGPSYPGQDPCRLLEAIVEHLRGRITASEQQGWLRSIKEGVALVRAQAVGTTFDDPLRWFETRELQELLSLMGSVLHSLGPPLFIFDTCEELMKLAPVRGTIPSVEATFRLIEELHDRCPALRVIFAGRRLLAQGGAGWTARPSPIARPLTAARDYLALHELRGFSREEAEEALARRLPEARRTDRALIDAILALSPEEKRAAAIERPAVTGTGDGDPPRHSPFRVVAYAGWIEADPALAVDALTGGDTDPYIEHRIVLRMGPLAGLLPVVALLRELDAATLTAVLGADEDVAATLEALADHEWIDVASDATRGAVLTAQPSVAEPLARYLALARSPAWIEACEQVAAALAPRLAAAGAVREPPAVIAAALRAMLELGGERAVRAWQGLEAGIGGAWAEAHTLTTALLDEGGVAEDGGTLLGAAVRATHASATVHRPTTLDVVTLWREVEAAAAAAMIEDEAPGEDGGPREGGEGERPAASEREAPIAWLLLQRARLGAAAAEARAGAESLDDQVDAIGDVLDELHRWERVGALATSVVGAVEAVVERGEREGLSAGNRLLLLLEPISRGADGLAAFAVMVEARLHALAGAPPPAQASARRALTKANDDGGDRLPATALDWRPPASLRARVQLEAVRLAFAEEPAMDEQHRRALLLAPPADATDEDSAHLRVALGLYAEARSRTTPASVPDGGSVWESPRHRAHARFPLDGLRLALCRDGRRPPDPGTDVAIRRHAPALVRATFAMDPAWIEPMSSADMLLFDRTSSPVVDRAPAVAELLAAPLPALVGLGVDVVDVWATQAAPDRQAIDALVAAVTPHLDGLEQRARSGGLAARLRVAATLEEIAALSAYTGQPLVLDVPGLPGKDELDRVHPDQVESVAASALRAIAAGRIGYPPSTADAAPLARWLAGVAAVIPRRVAQLAYDEAQLLALRLPERAITLCELAAQLSHACGDPIGLAAAQLAGDVARHRAGQRPAVDPAEVLAALERRDRDVLAPLVGRLQAAAGRGPSRDPAAGADRFLARFERGLRRKPPRRKVVAKWWRDHGPGILVGVVIVFIVAIIGGGIYALDRWALPAANRTVNRALGSPHGGKLLTGGGVVLLVALLFKLRPFGWLRDRSRDQRARGLVASARIGRDGDRDVAITLATADGQELALTARVPRAGRHPELVGPRGEHGLPLALAALVDRFAGVYPRPSPLPMTITVEPALAPYAWEAILPGVHPALFEVYAPLRPVSVRRPPARAGQPAVVLASSALRGELDDPVDPSGIATGKGEKGLVQAIGRPARSAATGIALDLGDRADAAPLAPAAIAPAGARLVILQGTPETASERPTDGFRSVVEQLRELAVALLEHGVAEVLVIPPLPLATMRKLQEVLRDVHTLDRVAAGRRDHAALADGVRRHLRGVGDPFHRAAALEVTLMVATVNRGTSFGALVSR
jgi:hypothetical protein